ncbi:NAD-dependent epimerase/dehydratase family protein [Leifsonia sp. Le1]|uniref:NAD-dependent epimerase/dehydratase family protein n=1 Tax=Leifsonia sp. Le1 TaxID=3404918 RepID=UPI003EC0ADA7
MNAPRTALVTGGAGFIGVAIARRFAQTFDRWVVLDSLHPQVHASGERPAELVDAAELVVGDVTSAAVWDELLAGVLPEVVIHLAAETGTAQSLDEASRHAEANVVGTTRMLDAFTRHGIVPSQIVLSSSRAVYGEGRWSSEETGAVSYPGQRTHAQLDAGEWDFAGAAAVPSSAASTVPHPTSVYGATKLAQENVLAAWCGSRDAALTVLRLQNVYGPGQSLINSYTGIVSLFSQLAREGASIPVYEDGLITRDFVFIEDVASAFEAAVLAGGGADGRTLDVGTGRGATILQLATEIAAYHGAPAPHICGAYRDGDVRFAGCTIDETQRVLGWSPEHSLTQGIAALQSWIDAELGSPALGRA